MNIEKSEHQQRVENFMVKAAHTVRDKPEIPTEDEILLRAKLIYEEAMETINAMGVAISAKVGIPHARDGEVYISSSLHGLNFTIVSEPNMVEVLDGLCDLRVVTTGTFSTFGISDEEPQRLIDESNLAKFDSPQCGFCHASSSTSVDMSFENGVWVCPVCSTTLPKYAGPYRRDDGKWIKPPWWKAPNLAAEIERQKGN